MLFLRSCHHWVHLSLSDGTKNKKTRKIFTSPQHVYVTEKLVLKDHPLANEVSTKNILRVWCTDCKRSISVEEDTSCYIYLHLVSVGCEHCRSRFMLLSAAVWNGRALYLQCMSLCFLYLFLLPSHLDTVAAAPTAVSTECIKWLYSI